MKTSINLFKKTMFFSLLALSVITAEAQDKATIKNIIASKNFVFNVQTINPSSGTMRQTSNEYDLRVFGDSLISYLPYFGRAYTAPLPGERGGYNFTSSTFDYLIKDTRKGGWEITIKPKDVTDFREFFLVISENGYGTLRAMSNNRQPISYYGYIAPVKQK